MKKILLVNKNPKNLELLANFFNKNQIESLLASDYPTLDKLIREEFALALLDITGFDVNIWNYCKKLQEKNIPFLIISAKVSNDLTQTSIKEGAKGVLLKPLSPQKLLSLVKEFVA